MIFSENRYPLFRIMRWKEKAALGEDTDDMIVGAQNFQSTGSDRKILLKDGWRRGPCPRMTLSPSAPQCLLRGHACRSGLVLFDKKRRGLLKRVKNADAPIGRVPEKSVSAAKNIARSIVQTCFSNRFRGFSLCCNARCDSKANVAD
jgi:hypothetical protein